MTCMHPSATGTADPDVWECAVCGALYRDEPIGPDTIICRVVIVKPGRDVDGEEREP
jgi:hypothetical protein